jgi:hypothetical protein
MAKNDQSPAKFFPGRTDARINFSIIQARNALGQNRL